MIPRSEALSLMVRTGSNVVGGRTGADRSEVESESELGCARGTKAGAGESVMEVLSMERGTADDAPSAPPKERKLAIEAPPPMDPRPLKVSGDIPP